jgi:hypothetical protein
MVGSAFSPARLRPKYNGLEQADSFILDPAQVVIVHAIRLLRFAVSASGSCCIMDNAYYP